MAADDDPLRLAAPDANGSRRSPTQRVTNHPCLLRFVWLNDRLWYAPLTRSVASPGPALVQLPE